MGQFAFDATGIAPKKDFDLLPAGKYVAQVIDSEVKDTSSGTGQYIKLTLEILEGEHANRRLWANLNVRNANAEAERIGQGELSALCHAVGRVRINDTADLHMIPIGITVKVRKDKNGQYPDQNVVSGYAAIEHGRAPAAPAAPAGKPQMPWNKRAA